MHYSRGPRLSDPGAHARTQQEELRVQRRVSAVLLGIAGILTSGALWMVYPHVAVALMITIVLCLIPSLLMLVFGLCVKSVPLLLWEFVIYSWTFSLISGLTYGAQLGLPQPYPMVVVFLDMALVNQLPQHIAIVTLVLSCLGILVTNIMEATDSFIPDIETFRHVCDCTDPPCRMKAQDYVSVVFLNIAVLVLGFYLTRRFAMQVLQEKAMMQATIETAEQIATCLGGFDLDAAEELLEGGEAARLPRGLTESLRNQLQNLRMYKPYLPKSCLPDTTADTPQSGQAAGGVAPLLAGVAQPLPDLAVKHCTLMVSNMHDTVEQVDTAHCTFAGAFSQVLQDTLFQIEAGRGMVDLFVGDRIMSHFNASRRCVQHATRAVQAAKNLCQGDVALNIAIATGNVHCGDMGCSDMRRFGVIGRLSWETWGLERAGRALGIAVLCNRQTQSDAHLNHELRLVPRLVSLLRRAPDRLISCQDEDVSPGPVYEVLCHSPAQLSVRSEEWMYEMQEMIEKWSDYNKSVRSFLFGSDLQSPEMPLSPNMRATASREPLELLL